MHPSLAEGFQTSPVAAYDQEQELKQRATALFGKQDEELLRGVTQLICCTGTTAFPSKRWEGDNTPEKVDWEGVRNLVSTLPSSVKRIVLVSSVGVTKYSELPWSIMNLFGVLKYKKMGEDFVRNSGIPYTIIRPGRLTDGPYTSYDLNTLLKATAGQRRAVLIDQGDKLVGEASRLVVAEPYSLRLLSNLPPLLFCYPFYPAFTFS
uniref:NAD(P)-binding domain-containing protein n=1 Tax=Kalanchoe fedtschenkoi TaxID=63787 RepID=A0A7N0VLA5_KALFE